MTLDRAGRLFRWSTLRCGHIKQKRDKNGAQEYQVHQQLHTCDIIDRSRLCQGLNPLLHISHYSVRMAKISILKNEGIIKKIPMSAASMSR